MTARDNDTGYVDHSVTYTSGGLKNLPHVSRLRAILSVLKSHGPFNDRSLADVGCSNGYVTSILRSELQLHHTTGFDHSEEHLRIARENYPDIDFRHIDLNRPGAIEERYDLVTCFEVLEHAGRLESALDNLVALTAPGGLLFLSVPIEIGARGTAKYAVKTLFYKYNLDELPQTENLGARYLGALLTGRRMSAFRDERNGWGTHFGFDYRDVDDYFRAHGLSCDAFNRVTTRFYMVRI